MGSERGVTALLLILLWMSVRLAWVWPCMRLHRGGGAWQSPGQRPSPRGPRAPMALRGLRGDFLETSGTPMCGTRVAVDRRVWAVGARAEGLGIRAVARVFEGAPHTVLREYAMVLLTPYGQWGQSARRQAAGPVPHPRWIPLPQLLYAQGSKTVWWRHQLVLYQVYDNFCLPHTSVRQALPQAEPTNGISVAKCWQPRTPAMAAGAAVPRAAVAAGAAGVKRKAGKDSPANTGAVRPPTGDTSGYARWQPGGEAADRLGDTFQRGERRSGGFIRSLDTHDSKTATGFTPPRVSV
jgi:hypothetical protein